MSKSIRILQSLIICMIFSCCNNSNYDSSLARLENLSSISPSEALDSLYAIDYDKLSASDKHYHDFLSVKIADKAYMTHTSDSLILKVIDFESNHRSNGRYAEALYYGGRVYSDLGDYPTALSYFQKALENLSPDPSNDFMKANIHSQYGRLLTSMRLYNEAIPHIESSLQISRLQKDTVNIIYNLQLLGGTCFLAKNYNLAEQYFKEALQLSYNQPPFHSAKSLMYLAVIKAKSGQNDSALSLIRDIPDKVKSTIRNDALAYASDIYLKAGIVDTAYLYAHEIVNSPDSAPREIGYQVLLSPKLKNIISLDSIYKYLEEYRNRLENFYDENEIQLAITQQTQYNYQMHDRDKERAENAYIVLMWVLVAVLVVSASLIIGILYFKNRNKSNIIKFQDALKNIEELKDELNEALKANETSESDVSDVPSSLQNFKEREIKLRQQLKDELLSLYENVDENKEIPLEILQSEVYRKLQTLITDGKIIKDNDPIWKELEETVLTCSPKFISNLNLLTLGNLTTIELQTALLIKCGVRPSQMAIIFGKSNGTIVSRRESLCMKVLSKKMGVKVIDAIIRLL